MTFIFMNLIKVLSFMVLMCACEKEATEKEAKESIKITIPTGYKGLFKLQEAPSGSIPTRTNDCLVYIIPTSGVLTITSLKPFLKWHSLSVIDMDSTVLEVEPESAKSNQIAFYNLTVTSSGIKWCFIGTHEQAKRYQKFSSSELEVEKAKQDIEANRVK